jgi:hypothetical protein
LTLAVSPDDTRSIAVELRIALEMLIEKRQSGFVLAPAFTGSACQMPLAVLAANHHGHLGTYNR